MRVATLLNVVVVTLLASITAGADAQDLPQPSPSSSGANDVLITPTPDTTPPPPTLAEPEDMAVTDGGDAVTETPPSSPAAEPATAPPEPIETPTPTTEPTPPSNFDPEPPVDPQTPVASDPSNAEVSSAPPSETPAPDQTPTPDANATDVGETPAPDQPPTSDANAGDVDAAEDAPLSIPQCGGDQYHRIYQYYVKNKAAQHACSAAGGGYTFPFGGTPSDSQMQRIAQSDVCLMLLEGFTQALTTDCTLSGMPVLGTADSILALVHQDRAEQGTEHEPIAETGIGTTSGDKKNKASVDTVPATGKTHQRGTVVVSSDFKIVSQGDYNVGSLGTSKGDGVAPNGPQKTAEPATNTMHANSVPRRGRSRSTTAFVISLLLTASASLFS